MSDTILPLRMIRQKAGPRSLSPETRAEMRAAAENWITCLDESLTLRRSQGFNYVLPTAPQIRAAAQRLGPLVGQYGVDSRPTYRALAALVTMCHPFVLFALLAGVRPTAGRRGRPPRGSRS